MEKLHYADYLQLEKLLSAQDLESEKKGKKAHDEMLFIVIHQAYELWFKQIIFEMGSIKNLFNNEYLEDKTLGLINSRLQRIVKILELLNDQIRIIETMTPLDFLDFRDLLQPASGFQSLQFRLFEAHLGLKWEDRSPVERQYFNSRLRKEERAILDNVIAEKSIRELIDSWLSRLPFLEFSNYTFWEHYRTAVENMLNSDEQSIQENHTLSDPEREMEIKNLKATRESFETLFDKDKYSKLLDKSEVKFSRKAMLGAIFIFLYEDHPLLHLPSRILNSLIEIDELIIKWRYAHALMAKRMLGTKIGTGGSSGHQYLKKTAQRHSIFSDLFNVSTFLLPKSQVPVLPDEIMERLSYHFDVLRKG
ncbi:MAG: tryptophan 2,3-dioxygenase [Halobacteriovoraceae bacterium]|nr:tryptophan 2,3-dioxygenase [Halobacteriovoraceae bacterium]MCB9093818.1 tryptophan 2,3-dioxygenase [Halobacteriovoraceae bacterium]